MGGNFKVRCVGNAFNAKGYTIGKVYEFRDGKMACDTGETMPDSHSYAATGVIINCFKDWQNWSCADWELVEENSGQSSPKEYKCKVCESEFRLLPENRYTTVSDTLFGLTLRHDAFDCPYCGCQNIVGTREKEEVINNE